MTTAESIIQTTQLTKSFDDVIAVKDVSFSVKKGEIFGFLGPNGAGKTTMIKMLTTLLRPSGGSAIIAQADIIKDRDNVRRAIGVVFQDPALDTELTGRENLDYHARMYNIGKNIRIKKMQEVLDLVDLTDKKDIVVKNYSGGMKRRLEIARGLMHSPQVLFLDEPTLGLDAQTRRAIWKYIKKMNKEKNTTIFLTTHYMDEADYLCDRIAIIDHGEILVTDTTERLKTLVGNDIITLTVSDQKNFLSDLKKISWIKNIDTIGLSITLGVEKGEEKIPLLIEFAQKHKTHVKAISLRKPTLDDAFLHYTGRSIRDEDASPPQKTIPHRFRRG
jgi:ABC-2 type transport system ATP-binding protein